MPQIYSIFSYFSPNPLAHKQVHHLHQQSSMSNKLNTKSHNTDIQHVMKFYNKI